MLKKTSVSSKTILNIAYPIMIGNLAQTLITFVDTAFLGHVGKVELSASMMGGLYYYVFATLAWGFSLGIQIIVARRFGENNYKRIGLVFEHASIVVSVLAISLVLLLGNVSESLLDWIIDSPEIYDSSLVFIKARYYGIFFVCFNYLFRAFYVGLSKTRVITYSTIIMASVNVFLDYALIFGNFGFPELGIAGAAYASVCAEVSALVFFIIYTLRVIPLKKYSLFQFSPIDIKLLTSIIRLSFPKMLQTLFSFSAWFAFFALIERLGDISIASSSIVRSVYMLMLIPVFAFGATANTLSSRIIGEGRSDEMQSLLLKILSISLLFILPYVSFCMLFPEQMASIYTNDIGLIKACVPIIYIICFATICMGFGMIYFEAVSGTGNTKKALYLEASALCFYFLFIIITTRYVSASISLVWSVEIFYAILIGIISLLFLKFARWTNTIV